MWVPLNAQCHLRTHLFELLVPAWHPPWLKRKVGDTSVLSENSLGPCALNQVVCICLQIRLPQSHNLSIPWCNYLTSKGNARHVCLTLALFFASAAFRWVSSCTLCNDNKVECNVIISLISSCTWHCPESRKCLITLRLSTHSCIIIWDRKHNLLSQWANIQDSSFCICSTYCELCWFPIYHFCYYIKCW